MTLYSFHRLEAKLDQFGFPKILASSGFQAIRTDFKKAYDEGKIEFRSDGIYLIHDGQEHKGYAYMRTYKVEQYGTFPRFHITKCSVIEEFLSSGIFNTYYEFSQHPTNDIEDRQTGRKYPEEVLQLCSRCSRQMTAPKDTDTEDFFEALENRTQQDAVIQVDINGYPKGWPKISKAFRKSKNYECETCSIRPTSSEHKRFWEVHHIDGNKTNNTKNNLKCLCILCHSNVDERHKNNYARGDGLIRLNYFAELYGEELRRLSNQYLT